MILMKPGISVAGYPLKTYNEIVEWLESHTKTWYFDGINQKFEFDDEKEKMLFMLRWA